MTGSMHAHLLGAAPLRAGISEIHPVLHAVDAE